MNPQPTSYLVVRGAVPDTSGSVPLLKCEMVEMILIFDFIS